MNTIPFVRPLGVALLAVIGTCGVGEASAQNADYPDKPIRVLVGESPGGATDIIARLVAKNLTEELGQGVVIDNRTGAAGSIASNVLAMSRPDGYTLTVVSSSFAINPATMKLPYDPQKDLVPISLLVQAPFLLVTTPSLKAKNVKDLVALAATKHGSLTYASGGTNSSDHLAGVLFSSLTKQPMTHIPYRGAGPALVDVMAGHVAFQFASALSSYKLVKQGSLRVLAVSSAQRLPNEPSWPTVAESGVPGYEDVTWYGMLAPKGTPDAILNKLSASAHQAVMEQAVHAQILQDGAVPIGNSPKEFQAFMASQMAKFKKLVALGGTASN